MQEIIKDCERAYTRGTAVAEGPRDAPCLLKIFIDHLSGPD